MSALELQELGWTLASVPSSRHLPIQHTHLHVLLPGRPPTFSKILGQEILITYKDIGSPIAPAFPPAQRAPWRAACSRWTPTPQ